MGNLTGAWTPVGLDQQTSGVINRLIEWAFYTDKGAAVVTGALLSVAATPLVGIPFALLYLLIMWGSE